MAKIPQYEPGQVRQRNIPEIGLATATPGAFGGRQAELMGQAGEGVGQFGKIMVEQAIYEQRKLNKTLARDALNQAQTQADDLLYGDNGLYTKKGNEVAHILEEANEGFERIKRDRTKDLTDQYAKDLFEASYSDYVSRSLSSLTKYRSDEIEQYNLDTLDAQNKLLMDEAVRKRNDEPELNTIKADIKLNVLERYKSAGPDVQAQKIAETVSLLHSRIIEGITDDSPEAAMEYLKKYRDEFDAVQAQKFEADLEKEIGKNKTFYDALKISESGADLEGQLAQADKADNPDEVRKLVRQRYKDKADIEDIKQRQFDESEFKKVQADPIKYDPPVSKTSPNAYTAMANYKRQVIAQMKAENGIGDPPETNWDVYYFLKAEIAKGNISKKALYGYAKMLHPTQWNELDADIDNARKGSGETYKLFQPHQYATDIANSISDLNIKSDDDKDTRQEKLLRRQHFFAEWEKRIQKLPEEDRTSQNMLVIANELLTPITDYRAWYEPRVDRYRFEMPYFGKEEKKVLLGEKVNYPESVKLYVKQKAKIEYKYNEDHGKDLYHVKVGNLLYLFNDEGEEVEWLEVVK